MTSPSVPVESREQPRDEVASMCGTGDLQPMSDPYRRPPPIVPSPPFVSDEAHWAEVMGRFTTLPDLVRAARALAYQALAESRDTIRELQAKLLDAKARLASQQVGYEQFRAERDRARDLAAHLEEQLARADERWCCDGCMALVSREQVTTWADGEHVLCGSCEQNQRFGEDMMRDVARACDEAAASTTGSALWAADLIREAVGLFPSTAAHLEAEQAETRDE